MFHSLLENRRSIRKFKSKAVETEKIDLLVEAALRSPSSRGFNPWEFVVITDAELIQQLAKSKTAGSSWMGKAPLAFVVCGDPEKSDVWVEDTSIATTIIHLAAASLGLGSCWVQIRKRAHSDSKSAEAYIQELLSIPSRLKILSMIAIGYPDEEKGGHPKSDLLFDKVSYNGYGKKA